MAMRGLVAGHCQLVNSRSSSRLSAPNPSQRATCASPCWAARGPQPSCSTRCEAEAQAEQAKRVGGADRHSRQLHAAEYAAGSSGSGTPVRWASQRWCGRLTSAIAAASIVQYAVPRASLATESLPAELFQAFADKVDSLGPYGPLLFMGAVVCAELIPLFPTQPLCLASGLLFGPKWGAIYILSSTLFAATLSFSLAKGVGRSLAESLVKGEVKDGQKSKGIKEAFSKVQTSIEQGNFWQQSLAVLALRMTPVVPFSAANYVLGLTPVKFPAYFGASALGMTLWATLYASIGGASRELLKSGAKFDVLLADVAHRASGYTEPAGKGALVLGLVAGAVYLATLARGQMSGDDSEQDGSAPRPMREDDKLERVKDRV